MRTLRAEVRNAAIGVGIVETADALSVIRKPGCAAVIWRRQQTPAFQTWMDAIDPGPLPSGRLVLPVDAVQDALHTLGEHAGLPESAERRWLEQDITDLAGRFANLMAAPFLRLRLDVVTTNACRKFHIDAITARLIYTYRGTGTQYGISPDGEPPQRVFTVATGSPMILRGTQWPENPPSGLLHRSPPIDGTGETRLVLVLDPVFDSPAED